MPVHCPEKDWATKGCGVGDCFGERLSPTDFFVFLFVGAGLDESEIVAVVAGIGSMGWAGGDLTRQQRENRNQHEIIVRETFAKSLLFLEHIRGLVYLICMGKNPVLVIGAAIVGAVILGCGGGGGGVSGSTDYVYYVDNGLNIIRQDFPTGNPFTLGTGTAMSEVRISPDKSLILFVNNGTLYVVNANGTGLTPLTGYRAGDWNSDGTKIFAISSTGNKIRSMNPDGTGVSGDIFDGNFGSGIASIDLNNQGTKIAIVYAPSGWFRIHTLNLDGSGLVAVTPDGSSRSNARWQPDGTSFVYEMGGNIRTVEADGTADSVLANTAANETMPSYRNNSTILYISDGDLWQMAADGTGQAELFDGTNPLSWPESKS